MRVEAKSRYSSVVQPPPGTYVPLGGDRRCRSGSKNLKYSDLSVDGQRAGHVLLQTAHVQKLDGLMFYF